MNKQIVLHFLVSNKFSGAENVVCQIINAYCNNSNVEMVYCSLDGPIRETLNNRGIRFFPLSKLSIIELRKAIKKTNATIIHAHDMRASFIAALATSKIPIISHIHNNNFNSRTLTLKSIMYRFAAYKAKHIIWVSENSFNGYYFHNIFKSKSSILYNVININEIKKRVSEDTNIYSYDIVYVGRFTYPKNPQRLIGVLKKVVKINSNVKIALLGDGIMKDDVVELISVNKLKSNIDCLGFWENPYKLLSNSKAMLMTSRWEGLPMCALESMSLGVPIVATPVGGLTELISNGEDGFLSEDDDVLASSLNNIVIDRVLQKRLSVNAENKMAKMMNIDNYRKTLDTIYGID